MILKIIKALSKQSKLIDAKLFPRAWLLSRVWSSLFSDRVVHLPWATKAFLVILIFSLTVGCSQKSGIARKPKHQFYQDITESYLPNSKVFLQGATFARADRKLGSDLIWFVSIPGKGAKINIFFNRGVVFFIF